LKLGVVVAAATAEVPECVLFGWGLRFCVQKPRDISVVVYPSLFSLLGNRCAKYGVRRDYVGHEAVLVAAHPFFGVTWTWRCSSARGIYGNGFWGVSKASKIYISGKQCFQVAMPAVNKTGVGVE
jgi:hypothetical protein